MPTLSGETLIRIWEQGGHSNPLERSMLILDLAFPQTGREALEKLSITERDGLLFSLHEVLFGTQMDGYAECPQCEAPYEYNLDAHSIRPREADQPSESIVQAGQFKLELRPPTTMDVIALAGLAEEQASAQGGEGRDRAAHRLLARRCLLAARRGTQETSAAHLPESAWHAAEDWLANMIDRSEIELDFTCGACGYRWKIPFDIGSFLYSEISSRAQRLIYEIDLLARAYGWSEKEILSLNPARRQVYVQVVSA